MRRREFMKQTAVSVLAAGAVSQSLQPKGFAMTNPLNSSAQLSSKGPFWPDGALHGYLPVHAVGLCRRHRRQDFVTLSVFSHVCLSAPFLLSQSPPLNCSKSMQKLQLLNPSIVERGMQLHVRS